MEDTAEFRIAAIVPCHNEEVAIAKVVADLKDSVPGIVVYVYDNLSTDGTIARALEAGAIVRRENVKGKGNVVRRAFADIEADIYLMIDGDDTYDAADAPLMIKTLLEGPYDHVLGVRRQDAGTDPYRSGHAAGNRALNRMVGLLFGENVNDMLSGFRVFSRRFVKSFPAMSRRFEIETELTVHALRLRVPQTALEVGFRDRPPGSVSKLHTFRDGFGILALLATLARHERPVAFYGVLGVLSWVVAGAMSVPILIEYWDTGLVPRFPTLFLAFTLLLVGCLMWTAGLILDGIRRSRHENSRLTYLRHRALRHEGEP